MKNTVTTVLQRKDLLALAILVLITVVVRVPGVYNRAIWYDEAITLLETAGHAVPVWSETPTQASTQKAFMVGNPTLSEVARGLRETDVHPPVYYGLLSIWRRVLGGSIETARIFSVVCSTFSVVLLYLLLHASRFVRPFAPSLVFALSSGAVHYAHEARNYSLAMFLIIGAFYLAFLAIDIAELKTLRFCILSISFAILCGIAFQTNYLSIFPSFALLLWYAYWIPRKKKLFIIPTIVITTAISLASPGALSTQLGARPNQFQKALEFGSEIVKIVDFNSTILWNPVIPSSGIQISVLFSLLALASTSLVYIWKGWKTLDKRFLSLIVGLGVAPSFGLLALDLVFSKDLGKPSYVLFAGPAIAVLLTLAAGRRTANEAGDTRLSAGLSRVLAVVVPFFIGLQLTGINFDLERTPAFAGSTLRSLAGRIEASSADPLVVIGAGHGRGDPASVIYELAPDTMVCVIDRETDVSALASRFGKSDDIWMVFAKGRMTADVERKLFEVLTKDRGYRVASRAKRIARLKKLPTVPDSG